MTAAETIRESDPYASVAIISEEAELLYSRVMLPSYVRGRVGRKQVFLRTLGDYVRNNIELWLDEHVVELKREERTVITSKDRMLSYGKLLIASGGTPRRDDLFEENEVKIMRFHTLEDADRLRKLLDSDFKDSALVIGGGFIGLEFIESFVMRNIETEVLMQDRWYFGGLFKYGGAQIIEENMMVRGVKNIYHDAHIASVSSDTRGVMVSTKEENKKENIVRAGVVGVGIGLKRSLELYRRAGLEASEGIHTDEYLCTNDERIYAAGDIAAYSDVIFEKRMLLGNWNNAFLQGKVAGENITGKRNVFRNVPNYSIMHLGLYISMIGDCDVVAADEIIERTWKFEKAHEELHIRNGVLVGASLINRAQVRPVIDRLIKDRIDLSVHVNDLNSPDFDIRTLVS